MINNRYNAYYILALYDASISISIGYFLLTFYILYFGYGYFFCAVDFHAHTK